MGQPIQPMVGEFKNGRGEFYDQELWKGRAVYVRFIWSEITPNSAHFEQSFSDDGGKTWEVNWILIRPGQRSDQQNPLTVSSGIPDTRNAFSLRHRQLPFQYARPRRFPPAHGLAAIAENLLPEGDS